MNEIVSNGIDDWNVRNRLPAMAHLGATHYFWLIFGLTLKIGCHGHIAMVTIKPENYFIQIIPLVSTFPKNHTCTCIFIAYHR